MSHLKKPYFEYNSGQAAFYPGNYGNITAENESDTSSVEKHVHVAASGNTIQYYIGPRTFKEITLQWLTDAGKTALLSFWDGVKDGSEFRYVIDDSVSKVNTTTTVNTTLILGDDSDGTAITSTEYVMETTDLMVMRDQVYGYWSTTFRMREVI